MPHAGRKITPTHLVGGPVSPLPHLCFFVLERPPTCALGARVAPTHTSGARWRPGSGAPSTPPLHPLGPAEQGGPARGSLPEVILRWERSCHRPHPSSEQGGLGVRFVPCFPSWLHPQQGSQG